MADGAVEVIYKGWLKKAVASADTKKKSFLNRQSKTWKKHYVVLLRQQCEDIEDECPFLCIYEKEPASESEKPKSALKLWPHYRVDKKHDEAGKTYIFEVRTPEDSMRLQSDSEANMDLWVFYLQIQTKLRHDFPGHCFEVTPDESDPMRRIGAKGSKCLLHISKWGLTLALKRTRSLLAQWPLKSIRIFESSETGAFSFEAGRSAPMGEARYIFSTEPGEDGEMYDFLDAFTTEMQEQRNGGSGNESQPATEEEIVKEYQTLRLATFGLLGQRSSSLQSPGTSAVSMAVPVPVPNSRGPTLGYDHLHRGEEELSRRSERRPPAAASKPQGIPISASFENSLTNSGEPAPPLPPRQEGLKHPPSSFQRSYSERGHSLERYGRSQEGREEESYAKMTPSSMSSFGEARSHRSFTEADIVQMAKSGEVFAFGDIITAEKLRGMLSRNPNANISEYEAMALRLGHNPYQNTGMSLLPNSYENTPLISPSPGDGLSPGFPNLAFMSSPKSNDSGPPLFPRKYQPPPKNAMAFAVSGSNPPIRHTYFQHNFIESTETPRLALKGTANGGRFLDHAGYSAVKRGTLTSHQYQEVHAYSTPQGTLKRSTSLDQFFRNRTLSTTSSLFSALSVDSSLIGSLDLATNYARLPCVPVWMGSRRLPTPPPLGTHTPKLNAYCGSPQAPISPLVDFSALTVSQTSYAEIKGNRKSFNNNNHQRQSLGEAQISRQDRADNTGLPSEQVYLEPIGRMKRSRSEGDILDVDDSMDVATELSQRKKSQSRGRSKSRGFFATLRKRVNSNQNLSKDKSTDGGASQLSKTSMKRSQSIPDLLYDRPPSRQNKTPSSNVISVKPASHVTNVAPVSRQKKFEFPLKFFRQSSKTADKEEGRTDSKEDSKSERRPSKSERRSSSEVMSPSKAENQIGEKKPILPGVKSIVASKNTKSFVKVRPQGPSQPQPITSTPKPTMLSKSAPADAILSMPLPNLDTQNTASFSEKASRDRLREVANRPLPSTPNTNNSPQIDVPIIKSNVKRFTPGMNRNSPQNSKTDRNLPLRKNSRAKKTPPPPPTRDPNTSLDKTSLKSSNSNASEYENTVRLRRSSEIEGSLSSEPERRISVENVSLQSSRPNSTGSQYENTEPGSPAMSIGSLPGSFSSRNSFEGGSLGKSPLSVNQARRISVNSTSRHSRTSSNASQYENSEFSSVLAAMGTPPAHTNNSGILVTDERNMPHEATSL